MRWFFLGFVVLLALAGNAAIFESYSLLRVGGGVAFTLFIASLLIVWWSAYFAGEHRRGPGLVFGHALLTLAGGFGLALLGSIVIASNSCEELMRERDPNGLRNQMLAYVSSTGYCSEVGYTVLALGMWLSYPSLRLFIGLARNLRASMG
ncbi:hypothetical protein [Hydrogenophaga sp. ANAO-22]|jgi:hypothetical protein|uniref:hypothetical protein n=1 Tax=Hydrogenophaga sp. ANAO-22 TaxID=3166645 RepID=UPI0036D2B93E